MIRLFAPKHTALSVVKGLEKGLNSGKVYLKDKDLVEDGYEIYSVGKQASFLSHVLSVTLATISLVIIGLLVFAKELLHLELVTFSLGVLTIVFMIVFTLSFDRLLFFPYRRRHITRQSGRTPKVGG